MVNYQSTPNNLAKLYFIEGQSFELDNSETFTQDNIKSNDFIEGLFIICSEIQSIYLSSEFLTITFNSLDSSNNINILESIKNAIEIYCTNKGTFNFKKNKSSLNLKIEAASPYTNSILETDSDIVKNIKNLIIERITPAVAMDGGEVVFAKYENTIVYVIMKGACNGCGSSTDTLKTGVLSMLKHFIGDDLITDVVKF